MSNSIIRSELESRLKTWADAQTPKIPIAFENVAFTKPTTGVFMEAFLLPNITLNPEVSANRKRLIGIFQINCWAKSGNGMKTVEQLAQNVIDLFPVMPKSNVVSIEETPNAEKHLLDSTGWVVVPVTIKYRAEFN